MKPPYWDRAKRALAKRDAVMKDIIRSRPKVYLMRRGEPFLAHVSGPTLGHAVTVVGMTPEGVLYLDPADGKPHVMVRAEFEREWDGTVVRIVK